MKAYWVVRGHILNPEEYAKSVSLRFLKQRSQRTSDFQSRANIG